MCELSISIVQPEIGTLYDYYQLSSGEDALGNNLTEEQRYYLLFTLIFLPVIGVMARNAVKVGRAVKTAVAKKVKSAILTAKEEKIIMINAAVKENRELIYTTLKGEENVISSSKKIVEEINNYDPKQVLKVAEGAMASKVLKDMDIQQVYDLVKDAKRNTGNIQGDIFEATIPGKLLLSLRSRTGSVALGASPVVNSITPKSAVEAIQDLYRKKSVRLLSGKLDNKWRKANESIKNLNSKKLDSKLRKFATFKGKGDITDGFFVNSIGKLVSNPREIPTEVTCLINGWVEAKSGLDGVETACTQVINDVTRLLGKKEKILDVFYGYERYELAKEVNILIYVAKGQNTPEDIKKAVNSIKSLKKITGITFNVDIVVSEFTREDYYNAAKVLSKIKL